MPIADAENIDLALISFSVLVVRNPRSRGCARYLGCASTFDERLAELVNGGSESAKCRRELASWHIEAIIWPFSQLRPPPKFRNPGRDTQSGA